MDTLSHALWGGVLFGRKSREMFYNVAKCKPWGRRAVFYQ